MKKLLNTLYVTSADTYLALDGENVVVRKEQQEIMRLPLHNLQGVVAFGYTGASPALMGACAKRGISLCFLTQSGRFLARVEGEVRGNVTLRKTQYMLSDDTEASLSIARNIISAKLYNTRWVLERGARDHALRLDVEKVKAASGALKVLITQAQQCISLEELRGVEGSGAGIYFSVFDELLLQQKSEFCFTVRSRRPPLDNVNALLSFLYSICSYEFAAALESVGLDPYVGYLHRDRPGRVSLALDLMEELRAPLVDRLVISLINKREINGKGFQQKENGAVIMDDNTRKAVLTAWQTRKQEVITHPYLGEKIAWGLVPHVQATLLARYLRGDLDQYPPFFWK